jgi:cell division protein ZapA
MDEAKVTVVHIFGREYKIKGFADKNYIQKVARFVDERMKELAKSSSLPSQERLAILAALNIADELFQERKNSTESLSSLERRADRLIAMLDESLLAER